MFLTLALAISMAPGAARTTVDFTKDSLEVVQENIRDEKAVLVDVRSLEEWKEGHLEGSIFLPVTSLRKHSFDPAKVTKTLPAKKEKKILYTFCVVGMRAKQAARILEEQGYTVRALKPGYEELIEAGFEQADEDRDSGMPDETYWESLFDVPLILSRLGIDSRHDVAELGCGYGTFSVPIAQAISGTLYTFDVDPAMLARTRERAAALRIVCEQRDAVQDGFGVHVDAVLLFNILHCENPVGLLRHAANALRAGGQALVIHWRYGETPRGPSLEIRPRPEQIIEWAADADLRPMGGVIDLPPWHYGLQLGRGD